VLFAGPAAPLVVHSSGHKFAPAPPPSYVVEIITGTKKETKSFEGQ